MARVVEALAKRQGRATKHEWDRLLDGRVWELEKGKDFQSQARSFVSQARTAAEERGLTLDSRTIEFEFLRKDPDNPKSPFQRNAKGDKVKDATVLQIVAYDPETHAMVDGELVEIEAEADDDTAGEDE